MVRAVVVLEHRCGPLFELSGSRSGAYEDVERSRVRELADGEARKIIELHELSPATK